MTNNIQICGYTEDLPSRVSGVKYYVEGVGTIKMRRGGLSDWQQAINEATEEILGADYSFNYIDPKRNQTIIARACADYLVVELMDDFKDINGKNIPSSRSNIKSIFENEENYSLVQEIVNASSEVTYFLKEVVNKEVAELKKS